MRQKEQFAKRLFLGSIPSGRECYKVESKGLSGLMQQIVARRNWVRLGLVGVWGVVAIAGLIAVYAHAFKNEDIGRAEVIWPSDSSLEQSPDRCTLVMFAHPRCPCTLASLDSLARVMGVADCKAVVVFWQPDSDSQPVESSSWRNSPSIKLAEKMQGLYTAEKGRRAGPEGNAKSVQAPRPNKEIVAQIQEVLKNKNMYEGPADGLTGPQTVDSIRQYQASHGMKVTGLATQDLLAAMLAGQ